MDNVLDGFSPAARRALSLAPQEMQRWGHSWIGPEHLLLAMLRDQSSVARVLMDQLAATDEVRRRLEASLTAIGPHELPPSLPEPGAKQVITTAREEAGRAGAAIVSTGHLLLALLAAGGSDVARILGHAGVHPKTVRLMLPNITAPGEVTDNGYEESGTA
jgi:ATP-dependent Clp protease ATP-binding subunit ClpA